MKTEIMKTRAMTATIPGMLVKIVTGTIAIAAGATLFTQEAMKMEVNENAPETGIFTSFCIAGATVMVGEIIGYFTATHEE